MLCFEIFKNYEDLSQNYSDQIVVEFLYKHLDEFGDSKQAIKKSLDYAFSTEKGKGGFLLIATKDKQICGVLIMNSTGMKDYIPENLLVYIAVDAQFRGQGIGSSIIKKAKEECNGNIALHVEYENPAKRLYERVGFKSKYAEMRWERKEE
jgi:ribosomal protein S18 acetylase RimI-like enzyme